VEERPFEGRVRRRAEKDFSPRWSYLLSPLGKISEGVFVSEHRGPSLDRCSLLARSRAFSVPAKK
jgi:hypothetical protein